MAAASLSHIRLLRFRRYAGKVPSAVSTASLTPTVTHYISHPTRSGVLIAGPIRAATFLQRRSRFSALVLLNGRETLVHVPNSGRMRELLTPGRPCLLAVHPGLGRKTQHDLLMVDLGDRWVGVDGRFPSILLADALARGAIPAFQEYAASRREVPYGRSRLDFLLLGDGVRCLLEAKNVNRIVGDTAVFPDAPTSRGVQHLRELMAAQEDGYRAAVVFIIQRDDAVALGPDEEHDPVFSNTLREAAAAGVALFAWRFVVSPEAILLDRAVPVLLE